MGYQVYQQGGRWAGYGVPAECDQSDCAEEIDRGLGYNCDYNAGGDGCEMFFCTSHLDPRDHDCGNTVGKPDSDEWVRWMLTEDSWQEWRDTHPERVAELRKRVEASPRR